MEVGRKRPDQCQDNVIEPTFHTSSVASLSKTDVLKGTRPRDIPVYKPTKFELVVNIKTAKSLGINVPPSIVVSASEVIE